MYIWIHDKYSSTSFKQRLWQRTFVLIWQNYFFKHACHCGALVMEFLARADKPGSTPGDAAFCFFAPFFFCLFFKHYFSFRPFFFIFTADPAGHALGSIIYFKLKSGVLFWKRDFKSSWPAWTSLRPVKVAPSLTLEHLAATNFPS